MICLKVPIFKCDGGEKIRRNGDILLGSHLSEGAFESFRVTYAIVGG